MKMVGNRSPEESSGPDEPEEPEEPAEPEAVCAMRRSIESAAADAHFC